jgi:hypothetical protein
MDPSEWISFFHLMIDEGPTSRKCLIKNEMMQTVQYMHHFNNTQVLQTFGFIIKLQCWATLHISDV